MPAIFMPDSHKLPRAAESSGGDAIHSHLLSSDSCDPIRLCLEGAQEGDGKAGGRWDLPLFTSSSSRQPGSFTSAVAVGCNSSV